MTQTLRPSATAVLLRQGAGELEVLLARRNPGLRFAPGCWVFPGGVLAATEPDAHAASASFSEFRAAAVRELEEETSLVVPGDRLEPFAEWITPVEFPQRFRTVFFLGPYPGGEARADGSEIVEVRVLPVAAALAEQRAGALPMLPPTFVTLAQLEAARSWQDARSRLLESGIRRYRPVLVATAEGNCALYEGDADYPGAEPGGASRRRHRLWLRADGWTYERTL